MKQLDVYLNRHFRAVFWFLIGTCFLAYLALIGGDYIWTDESFSIAMVKHSFREIWKITAMDNHPPLYYWYLKAITAPWSYSFTAAKIASILPYILVMIFGGYQFRKYFNERTGILFVVLFFCFPFLLAYSIEVRMYSLASALVFICAFFAYRFRVEQGRNTDMAGLIIFGVLAAYTHNFAFAAVCMIYGLLFLAIITGSPCLLKRWALSAILSLVLYAPWLFAFIAQLTDKVQNGYWIDDITKKTLINYWRVMFGAGGFAKYQWFFSLAYLLCFVWVLSRKEKRDTWLSICCILVPVGVLTAGILASVIIRPVFVIRYLLPSVPLLIAFMAIVLGKMTNEMLFGGIMSIVLIGGISNYAVFINSEYNTHNYVPIEQYRDVDAYIVPSDSHVSGTLGYYVANKTIYAEKDLYAANVYPNQVLLKELSFDSVDSAILLLPAKKTPPEEYCEVYDITSLGQWKCERVMDAFLLTKKAR